MERGTTSSSHIRWIWIVLITLIVLAIVVISPLLRLFVNLLWFGDLGYRGVYTKMLWTRVALGGAGGALFFVIVLINMIIARRSAGELPPLIIDDSVRLRMGRWAQAGVWYLLLGAAALMAIIVGGQASGHWLDYLRFAHAHTFNLADPILNKDASFYVFRLPLIAYAQKYFLFTLVMAAIAVTTIQYLGRAIDMISGYPRISRRAIAHLSFLLGLVLLAWAVGYWLRRYGMMYADSGKFTGPAYTDANVRMAALQVMAIGTVIVALVVMANAWVRRLVLPVAAVVALVVLSIAVNGLWPGLVQTFRVKPNEIEREAPYIANTIRFTRVGYGLKDIVEHQFPAATDLSSQDIADNSGTIRNIRIWDYRQLAKTYSQLQIIRPYYQFHDVDVDRYTVDGTYQQVLLSPREINIAGLDDTAQTWVNRHLIYTHGYGLCMSPANRVTETGLPDLTIRDIPPVSDINIRIENPAIYFGEGATDYALVDTTEKEFDYPSMSGAGEENVYATYTGTAGIRCGGLFRRIAFGLYLGDTSMVFTGFFTKDSRILLWRQIVERARKITPFLHFDDDPYMVISGGKLYWISDAYTVSGTFPYSAHNEFGLNYVRNSVKVVVDAYNGTVDYYVFEPKDPILLTYASIFPGVFKPVSEMPEDLRAHTRHPEWLFRQQAEALTLYHMTDPKVFYNREDQWKLATVSYEQQERPMDAYYVIMRLPGETRDEFVLMLPYTPVGQRKNMIAWLCARCDGLGSGTDRRLQLYRFPKKQLVYGPLQLDSRINQVEQISEKITLWGQQQSKVIQGTLLVIPIKHSILYVQPVYVAGTSSPLPELRRVIVAYGDRIEWDRTLDGALERIFGASVPPTGELVQPPSGPAPPAPEPATPEAGNLKDLAAEAAQHYQNMIEAQRAGDWARYGDELKALGKAVEEMEAATK
jgi:uncharacterized membrane protein (UPF0182 family)